MAHFCGSSLCTHSTTRGPSSGNWINVTNRYLGLKFLIKGKVHYGWARLNVTVVQSKLTVILTGYAYETITGRSIIAGRTKGPAEDRNDLGPASLTAPTWKPATLGALALGAPGLTICRREEAVVAAPEGR